jgi:hypothetical protein
MQVIDKSCQSRAVYLPDLLNLTSLTLAQLNYQHANDVEEEEEVQLWTEESYTVVAVARLTLSVPN